MLDTCSGYGQKIHPIALRCSSANSLTICDLDWINSLGNWLCSMFVTPLAIPASPLCLSFRPRGSETNFETNATLLIVTVATPYGQEWPPSVALDYWGRLRRRSHSPRAERIKVKPPSPPSTQSIQTKKKPRGDLAISP